LEAEALATSDQSFKKQIVGVTEKDRFEMRCLIQLTTSNAKTTTYFARDKNTNELVVVKGPFLDSLQQPLLLNFIKPYFAGLVATGMDIVKLIPNQFDNVPLGIRTKITKGKEYSFLIMEDHCKLQNIPTQTKNSKLWPDTVVYDSTKVKSVMYPDPSVLVNDPPAMISYLLALSFRYIFQVVDPATRNFLYIAEKHHVISLDEESYGVRDAHSFWNKIKATECLAAFKFAEKSYSQILVSLQKWETALKSEIVRKAFTVAKSSAVLDSAIVRWQFLCTKDRFLQLIKNSTHAK
jgi:hypothetical protein